MKTIKYLFAMHKFFVAESKSFVGSWVELSPTRYIPGYKVQFGYFKYNLRQKIYLPFAYCKFMYYSFIWVIQKKNK